MLAQAVQELFPDARLGIGPPIENGFYYDFDVATPFTPDDLARIEKRMQQIVKESQTFSRRVVTDDEARAELADEPYKLELIGSRVAPRGREASVEVGGASSRSTTTCARTARWRGRTCAAGRTCRPPGTSRRSS